MAVESEQSQHYSATLRRALELYVGRGKRVSAEELSEVTGVACNTLYAYKRGELVPSFQTVMALLSALPAGFANMVLAPAGLTAHRVDDLDNDTHRLHAELAATVAKMADMLRDGRFDHREIAELEQHFPGLAEMLNQWIAAQKAAPSLRAVEAGE